VIRIGPIVWELDGPGPILKNSSTIVITGPFDFWTTVSSGETLEAAGAADRAGSALAVVSAFFEQPDKAAAAAPARAVRASSRRLIGGAARLVLPAELQDPHAPVSHALHPLAAFAITGSELLMSFLSHRRADPAGLRPID
jgi:hypothetical protein